MVNKTDWGKLNKNDTRKKQKNHKSKHKKNNKTTKCCVTVINSVLSQRSVSVVNVPRL